MRLNLFRLTAGDKSSETTPRVAKHNLPLHSNGKYTTKNKGLGVLAHSDQFESRSEAVAREKE